MGGFSKMAEDGGEVKLVSGVPDSAPVSRSAFRHSFIGQYLRTTKSILVSALRAWAAVYAILRLIEIGGEVNLHEATALAPFSASLFQLAMEYREQHLRYVTTRQSQLLASLKGITEAYRSDIEEAADATPVQKFMRSKLDSVLALSAFSSDDTEINETLLNHASGYAPTNSHARDEALEAIFRLSLLEQFITILQSAHEDEELAKLMQFCASRGAEQDPLHGPLYVLLTEAGCRGGDLVTLAKQFTTRLNDEAKVSLLKSLQRYLGTLRDFKADVRTLDEKSSVELAELVADGEEEAPLNDAAPTVRKTVDNWLLFRAVVTTFTSMMLYNMVVVFGNIVRATVVHERHTLENKDYQASEVTMPHWQFFLILAVLAAQTSLSALEAYDTKTRKSGRKTGLWSVTHAVSVVNAGAAVPAGSLSVTLGVSQLVLGAITWSNWYVANFAINLSVAMLGALVKWRRDGLTRESRFARAVDVTYKKMGTVNSFALIGFVALDVAFSKSNIKQGLAGALAGFTLIYALYVTRFRSAVEKLSAEDGGAVLAADASDTSHQGGSGADSHGGADAGGDADADAGGDAPTLS